jgi:hypothetical protein
MSGIIKKFLRGAAGNAAEVSREELKAQILADRDSRLAALQSARQEDQQEFQAEQNELSREAQANSPQAQLAGMKLEDSKAKKALVEKINSTEDLEEKKRLTEELQLMSGNVEKPTARQSDVEALAADKNITKSEAWDFLKGNEQQAVFSVFNSLQKEQEANSRLRPGKPGYLTTEEMLDKAFLMIESRSKKNRDEDPLGLRK